MPSLREIWVNLDDKKKDEIAMKYLDWLIEALKSCRANASLLPNFWREVQKRADDLALVISWVVKPEFQGQIVEIIKELSR